MEVDDYSRTVWTYLLKSKFQRYTKFVEWKTLDENQSEKKLKILRKDNGLEFLSNEFKILRVNQGIERITVKCTPQQKGLAKRMNKTLLEKVRCLMSNANLPRSFGEKL